MTSDEAGPVVLLFGASGQIGRTLQEIIPHFGSLVAYDRAKANFEQPESLREIVRSVRPAVIVNAAAYTAVDRAESEPGPASLVNSEALALLAQEADRQNAILVHYSTDYVFDGKSAAPYSEQDIADPLSVYGKTKYAGERNVLALCRRHLIFRTSWVMSPYGHNFLKTILHLSAEKPSLRIVNDQFGAPTSAAFIAATTLQAIVCMKNASPTDSRWGLYHLAARGDTSWHGYAQYVVERASGLGFNLLTTPDSIYPITTAEYLLPAPRPANSRLDTSKLRRFLNSDIPHWTECVDDTLNRLMKSKA